MRFFAVLLFFVLTANALVLQKANSYNEQNISGWLMSEKLDGIRAYWDGKTLQTRQGKVINAPAWFLKDLPAFVLDGELWSKRGDFENIQSIVMDDVPSEKWHELQYMVFEVPQSEGNFTQRLQKAADYMSAKKLTHVKIIEQKICKDKEDLAAFHKQIQERGGEGVMVKDGSLPYFDGRSDSILKVKKAEDAEAKVIGYKKGSGKYKGLMGSLQVELENGTQFFIGSGFSDAQRANPPKMGSIVTFSYFGLTKLGKPKFASFLHERRD
ncbi:MAG: DNA ligase [Sulfurimonas sp.]|nr:DNA ligase [Sulfurimonas sp.]MDD3060791.1 DNA ligase [Sulfurimonas sp.]